MGFFLGLISLSLGIIMLVAAVYIFRKHRQDKFFMMLSSSGGEGYRIMTNQSTSNSESNKF